METSLPTPNPARVELLMYRGVTAINLSDSSDKPTWPTGALAGGSRIARTLPDEQFLHSKDVGT